MEVYVDNKIKSRTDNDLQLKPIEPYKVELQGLQNDEFRLKRL